MAPNFLLFDVREDAFAEALKLRPAVMQFAWARQDQDLKPFFDRSHEAGCKVTYMAGAVKEAERAVKAGADVIIAQGSEGGGHVGWMGSMPLIPMVVDAVGSVPVLAAGGFADGRGLVAALSLGAQGILLGTRFLASVELPLHPNFKQAIVDSDGHDTQLSEIPGYRRGSGLARRHDAVAAATSSSSVGPGGNGTCGRTGPRRSPSSAPRARPATSTRVRCRWARTPA